MGLECKEVNRQNVTNIGGLQAQFTACGYNERVILEIWLSGKFLASERIYGKIGDDMLVLHPPSHFNPTHSSLSSM